MSTIVLYSPPKAANKAGLSPSDAGGTGLASSPDMQHAANVTLNEADVLPQDEAEFSALLRLRQGSSARSTWVVEESPGGTMVSVGADEACDWQLRAAFVPARAFSVLVVGGRTFVRSGPEPGVLLDGKPLADGWVQVHNGARVDVGLARLEVTMGYGDWLTPSHSQSYTRSQLLETTPYESNAPYAARETIHELHNRKQVSHDQPHAGDRREPVQSDFPSLANAKARGDVAQVPAATQPPVAEGRERSSDKFMAQTMRGGTSTAAVRAAVQASSGKRGGSPRRNATIELTLDDLDYMGTAVIGVPGEDGSQPVSGEYAVGEDPHTRYSAAPSLLGRETPKDKSKLWRYAVAGVVTVGAYGGWVFLLDYL